MTRTRRVGRSTPPVDDTQLFRADIALLSERAKQCLSLVDGYIQDSEGKALAHSVTTLLNVVASMHSSAYTIVGFASRKK